MNQNGGVDAQYAYKTWLTIGDSRVKGQGHKSQKVQQPPDAVLDTFPLDYDVAIAIYDYWLEILVG